MVSPLRRNIMNTREIFQCQKDVEYLVDRAVQSKVPLLSPSALVDLLVIKHLIAAETEAILKEDYHQLEINLTELRKEVKNSREFQIIRTRKAGDILDVEQTKEGSVCLITQKPITQKLAAPCGHCFNREGVLFLYENTRSEPKKFACPHLGCEQRWKYSEFAW